jgi:UDP-GlcNAc:undecaprenyl-phosphate GlcNAc-1-phosphate transferase
MSILLAGAFVAFLAACLITPLINRLAVRKNWIDHPDGKRTVHRRPTPRAGGLAVIFAFLIGLVVCYLMGNSQWAPFELNLDLSFLTFLAGGVAMALTGLYDDAYGLGFKKKFLCQLIVSYAMFLAGFRIEIPAFLVSESDLYLQAALGLPITLLWFIAVMNAVNLIDGLDGLASGISLIAFASLACIFLSHGEMHLLLIALVMVGALTGFLVFNFYPASIFLGDTGSLFIGFVLATYSLQGTAHDNPVLGFVVLGLAIGFPLLDTSLAFTRRVLRGDSPFRPDKDHVHHRLMSRLFNLSTRRAVLLLQ